MASATPTFTTYLTQVRENPNIPVLGFLVCWYVPEALRIEHAAVERSLDSVGLKDFTPPEPRDADVFKRICTSSAKRRQPTKSDDVFENILVREVGKDEDRIWRHVVVEEVDGSNRRLDYFQPYEVVFDRSKGRITQRSIGKKHAGGQRVIDEIKATFELDRGRLNAYSIREMVRYIVTRKLRATTVRPSGGVYFVAAEHTETLAALDQFVNGLPLGTQLDVIPLIDDERQRAMVRRAFEEESVGEVDKLIMEMSELGASSRITPGKWTDIKDRYDLLRTKVREYSDVLGEALELTAARLEVASEQINTLLDKAAGVSDDL